MSPAEIRTIRQALGLTQGQAARLIGVTQRAWQYWEAGARQMPAMAAKMLRICGENPEMRKLVEKENAIRTDVSNGDSSGTGRGESVSPSGGTEGME